MELEPRERVAARVLLIDEQDRVLLFRGADPAEPEVRYWFTPGGGLDPGESFADAAARELAEETGLRVPVGEIGEPVHDEVTLFSFDGISYRQEQRFFVVRARRFEVSTAGFDSYEVDSIDRHHWWSVAELERTEDAYYPTDLVAVLKRLGISSC
ncbi:MAG TPA: NUDIX domain-containing protein [Candidatus Limnocylindrales bacterium]